MWMLFLAIIFFMAKNRSKEENTRHCRERRLRRKQEDPVWYAKKANARVKDWRDRNREKLAEQRRRSNRKWNPIRRSVTATRCISEEFIQSLLLRQKAKCAVCAGNISSAFHVDHIVPLVLGGPHSEENLQLLCKRCNLSKGGKHPVDFMRSRGFLL